MFLDPISAIQSTLKINRAAATFIAGGFLVFTLALSISAKIDDGTSAWMAAVYLLVFSIVVLVLTTLPNLPKVLLGWMLTIIFAVWLCLVFIQMVSHNSLFPKFSTFSCLLNPFQVKCEQLANSTAGEQTASNIEVVEFDVVTAEPDIDRSDSRVWVQFAEFSRETVVEMASNLVALGWPIQGARHGGEEIPTAISLNEIRYFHETDLQLAQTLAVETSAELPSRPMIEVKDWSKTKYAPKVKAGHLEVWISK